MKKKTVPVFVNLSFELLAHSYLKNYIFRNRLWLIYFGILYREKLQFIHFNSRVLVLKIKRIEVNLRKLENLNVSGPSCSPP